MRFKYIFFAVSLVVILPGLYSLGRYGLRLSVDFTGGSVLEAQDQAGKTYVFREREISPERKTELLADKKEVRFEVVGPVIGQELTKKAIQAVVVASLAIVAYIAYAFRTIPAPYSPWKFGVAAVVALLHDVLVVVGMFSLLGHLLKVEIDALFVTALLTIIGFSVHDTIVVFDRIRENLNKVSSKTPFSAVVNDSIWQTLARSLMTSLTVVFTLLALVLFGGESIRWFVVALLIGIISGTYSSIFNAAPLLVVWEERKRNN